MFFIDRKRKAREEEVKNKYLRNGKMENLHKFSIFFGSFGNERKLDEKRKRKFRREGNLLFNLRVQPFFYTLFAIEMDAHRFSSFFFFFGGAWHKEY